MRIWMAGGLAMFAALITCFTGFFNQARFMVILYRMLVSILLFGGIGYLVAFLYETKWKLNCISSESRNDQEADLKTEPQEALAKPGAETAAQAKTREKTAEQKEFSPFTADTITHVSPPRE